ncbi:unnamed protein product [Rodentolepis nana]|uniref:DUF2357 domain-containing protein n=1 Tax=Rodentolepis nana TaxID=102285 RepID=A0A0R3U0S0_RODNA|nr:unnamed protein product [Rodentolepis nana]
MEVSKTRADFESAVRELTELIKQYAREFLEIYHRIRDFEFDCHQVSQLILSGGGDNEINSQIWAYLRDFKEDIALFAPFSYFSKCALEIFPLVKPFASVRMTSRHAYDFYCERGRKMRLALEKLKGLGEKFHRDSIDVEQRVFFDPYLRDEMKKYLDCWNAYFAFRPLLTNLRCSWVPVVATFFKHRRIVRSKDFNMALGKLN